MAHLEDPTAVLDDNQQEQQPGIPPELSFDDGEIAPHIASPYDDVDLSDDLRATIKSLVDLVGSKDIAARRWEVESTWEARLFWRGYQYLLPRRGGGWIYPPLATNYSNSGRSGGRNFYGYETNIYSTYGEIAIAALTRDIPRVEFRPMRPSCDADITASDAATRYSKIFNRTNNLRKLQTQLAWYLWTDDRALIVVDHIVDAQRFGRAEPQEDDPVVPETEAAQDQYEIYVMRHGETERNVTDEPRGRLEIPLDEKGHREAMRTGEWLKDKGISLIVSSPVERAIESAYEVSQALDVPVETDDRLASLDLGDMTDDDAGPTSDRVAEFFEHPGEQIPGSSESPNEFDDRVASVMRAYLGKGTVLFVTHDSVVCSMFRQLRGGDLPPSALIPPGGVAGIKQDADNVPEIVSLYPAAKPEASTGQTRGAPRGQEVAKVYGKLEHRVPMGSQEISEMPFAMVSFEIDVADAKARFPKDADKIKPGGGTSGENELDRIARINVNLALQASYVTGDSMVRDCTIQYIWFRPAFFMQIEDRDKRCALFDKFPDGLKVTLASDQIVSCRNECMDDHLTLIHGLPGSGQNRLALGGKLLSLQKRLNTWLDLLDAYFVKTVPGSYVPEPLFDVEALSNTPRSPGDYTPYSLPQLPDGRTIKDLIQVEELPLNNPAMPQMIMYFIEKLPQLLSHAMPSLFGAESNLMDVNELIPCIHMVNGPGFVRNGDLEQGDTIFGQDGKPYVILAAHEIKIDTGYRVCFDDGTSTVTHDGHLWHTCTESERSAIKKRTPEYRRKRRLTRKSQALQRMLGPPHETDRESAILRPPEGAVRTTGEIMRSLSIRHGRKISANHAIRIAEPIYLPDATLPIDPYMLGVWLGDGTEANGSLTIGPEDAEFLTAELYRCGFRCIQSESDPYHWCVEGLSTKLQAARVRGNKHIPPSYLWSSISQRLSLLQGLMDTDGCAVRQGQSKFSNTNKVIVDGVYHLASSLGLKVSRRSYISKPKLITANKKYGPFMTPGGIETWELVWTSPLNVFRLPRKLKRLVRSTKKSQWRYITNIEAIGPTEMRCLTTDNPSGLYLFGKNFNVTHNTDTYRGIAIQRDQALEAHGTPWGAIQEATASYFRQAVQLAGQCRTEAIDGMDESGNAIRIELADLKGKVLTYPESDANFPESWIQKQSRYQQMIGDAATNPFMASMLSSPSNARLAKDMAGFPEMTVPGAEEYEKQMGEFDVLLATGPMPNPAFQQLQAQSGQLQSQVRNFHALNRIVPDELITQLAAIEQQMQSVPPMISTVPVDKDTDNHAVEAQACLDLINNKEGRRLRNGTPEERDQFSNLRLHYMEHKALVLPPDPKEKPPSMSINYKDVPPDAAAKMLTDAGLETTGQDVAQTREHAAIIKRSGKVGGPVLPGQIPQPNNGAQQ